MPLGFAPTDFGIAAGLCITHASLPGSPQLVADPLLNSSQWKRKPFGPSPQTTSSMLRERR